MLLTLSGAAQAAPPYTDVYTGGWGWNTYGQLGNASNTDSNVPVLATATGALAGKSIKPGSGGVSGGDEHACAVTTDGVAVCWGRNDKGQLGTGNKTDSNAPVAVDTSASSALSGKTVASVRVGDDHSCAVTTDGIGVCWGNNTYGQLGDGTTTQRLYPTLVDTSPASALNTKTVAWMSSGGSTTCAAATDGTTTACWGRNTRGQVGDGTKTQRDYPTLVDTSSGSALSGKLVAAVSVGYQHTCALTSEGLVACWGHNNNGQLGINTTKDSLIPASVYTATGPLAGQQVASIASGYNHTCATTSAGAAVCWGLNSNGQLGDGSGDDSIVPVAVSTAGVLAGKTVRWTSAGNDHSCATLSDGTGTCWGRNNKGQLGDSTNNDSLTPVAVTALSGPPGVRPLLYVHAINNATVAQIGWSTRASAPLNPSISGTPTTLSWDPPSYSGFGTLTYNVYYRPSGSGPLKLFAQGISTTSFDLSANASSGCTGATRCARLYGALRTGTSYDWSVIPVTGQPNNLGRSSTTLTHVWAG